MATPWDRASQTYVAEWAPRFTPYHLDLVDELMLDGGERVLVPCCGTGAEVVAVVREVGEAGKVRATDADSAMVASSRARLDAAGFPNVPVEHAPAEDTRGGPWDAVLCAFGLWQLDHREQVLAAWEASLAEHGKIGVLTWGPPEESDPFELLSRCLAEHEPGVTVVSPRIVSERDSMDAMFHAAGLALARHTIVRHTLSFATAEAFVTSLRHVRSWHDVFERLGDERMNFVAARFYDLVGGPNAPLAWDPPATLAVAARPGTEIALRTRPSLKVPI